MANTKISQLTPNTNPTGSEELVYAFNNANGKMTLNTMKTFSSADSQATLVSWVNIKTINNQSILWSGNLDVSWWGGGSWQPTELGWDANIWELSEWIYVTEHDLYYITWEKVPTIWSTGSVKRQMLSVTTKSEWVKWFFAFSAWSNSQVNQYHWYASYWYSMSSSIWRCYILWEREWALKQYEPIVQTTGIDSFQKDLITQVVNEIWNWTNDLRISTTVWREPYPWVTYTIYINSVASWKTYTITLWNWVTNPFGITLPSNSTKKCVITVLITSTTTGIVTSCVMEP